MPLKLPDGLPAKTILEKENRLITNISGAYESARPLKIGILNLMPDKLTTEIQLLRLLSNTPFKIDITLLYAKSHKYKNTSLEYLTAFYKDFEKIRSEKFDGFIITGAPIEHLKFEEVDYWAELTEILEWTKNNTLSIYHICWGAQAGLYYHYGINKYKLPHKIFGVFEHIKKADSPELFRGFDDIFHVPHSRHTEVRIGDINKAPELRVLSESKEAGLYIAANTDYSQIFVMGHSEYDPDTLKKEYLRDVSAGKVLSLPQNYFINDNPENEPFVRWRAHGYLLYNNWVNMIYRKLY